MLVSLRTKGVGFVRAYIPIIFEPLWVLMSFTFAALLFSVITSPFTGLTLILNTTVGQLFSSVLLYAIALTIVIAPMIKLRGKQYTKNVIGINKSPTRSVLWLPFLLWLAYMITTMVVAVITSNLPFIDSNQAQDVGFEGISQLYEYILVFIALVVLPPIAEELLFRGYLFGRLRERFGFWVTAIVVSVAFGAIHLQWNVGIDVAILSLFLCYVREKTGSIWASMVLHAIKNGVAYALIFIAPLFGYNLL